MVTVELGQEILELFGCRFALNRGKIQGGRGNQNPIADPLDPATDGALADRFLAITGRRGPLQSFADAFFEGYRRSFQGGRDCCLATP